MNRYFYKSNFVSISDEMHQYFSQNINYQPVIIVDETRLFPENVCRVEKDYWKIWKIPLEKRILRTKFCLSPYFSRYAGGKPLRPCHPYVAILSRKRISPCSRSLYLLGNKWHRRRSNDENSRLFDREFSKFPHISGYDPD